jgi:formate-dependent nitrite reductase membrane component NrfD
MPELDINRHSHLIDPHLHIWGWEVAAYLFLGGMAAGIMIFAALAARKRPLDELSRWLRWAPFAVPALVSLGMLCLFLDLENPTRVYRFYLALRVSSPMSWGAWILLLIYPATVLWGLAGLTPDEVDRIARLRPIAALRLGGLLAAARNWAHDRADRLRVVNVALGATLGLYTGVLLGTLEARPLWGSTLLAPLFLASGLSTGAAFLMLLPLSEGEHHRLRRWDLLAIAAEVLFLTLFLMDRATSGAAGQAVFERFFGGDLTPYFWALVVFVGLVVPVVLEVGEAHKRLRPTAVAPVLILVGGLALRWILVEGGQNPALS